MTRQAHLPKASTPPIGGTGRIRTKSMRPKRLNGPNGAALPEIYIWAWSGNLLISADYRDVALDDLQIRVSGACLIIEGTPRPDLQSEGRGNRRAGNDSTTFCHALDLPYEVNDDKTEVQNENGLVTIVLKRKKAEHHDKRAVQSSLDASMQRFFGEDGDSLRNLKDEITILETLDRYPEYHLGKGFDRQKGGGTGGAIRS